MSQIRRLREQQARQREQQLQVQRQVDRQAQQRALRGKPQKPKTISPEEIQRQKQEQLFKQETQKMDNRIEEINRKIEQAKKGLSGARERGSEMYKRFYKNQIREYQKEKGWLSKLKGKTGQGYFAQDLIDFARQKASAYIRGRQDRSSLRERKRELQTELKKEGVELTSKQIIALQEGKTSLHEFTIPQLEVLKERGLLGGYAQQTQKIPTTKVEIIKQDIQNYQGMGFSKSEAEFLAEEGAKQGITYLPEGAKQIIKQQQLKVSPKSDIGVSYTTPTGKPICYLKPEDVPSEFRDVIASEDIGGFGRVSAQDLKGELDIGGYGITPVLSGVSDGVSTRDTGGFWSGITDFIGFGDSFEKGRQEGFQAEQKFNITTGEGTLVSAYGLGAGGTALFYPLTLEQMKAQEFLTPTEQKIFGVEEKSESALLIRESKLKAQQIQIEKVEELKKEINEIYSKLEKEGKIDTTTNTFTDKATQTETSQYNKLYNRLEREKSKLGDRELYVGLGAGLGKKVDVSGVETGVSLISQTVGVVGGKAAAKLGKEEGYFTLPEKEVDIYMPQFGTQIIDPVTGEPMTGKEKIIVPEIKIGKPEQFEIVGELGATLALYSTPIIGTGLFTYEIGKEFKEAGYSPIKFVTENPIEAILLGTIGASKIAKLYRRTLGKPIIDTEKLTLGAGKEIQPYGFASRPKIIQVGEKTFIQREVGGISQTIQVGQRTIITTRIRKWLGLNPIYLGNPYIEQAAYQKALNLLIKSGHTEKSARQILRLRRPKFKENIFKGEALTIYGDDISLILKGKQETKDILGAKFEDLMLKKDVELRRIYAKGFPYETKKGTDLFKLWQKETKSYLTKQGREFQKLSQAGKTTEQYAIITGVKKTGETTLPLKRFDDILLGKEFEVFKEASLAQKIIPKQRKITDSLSKIFIEKGEPKFKITFDTGITKLKGFRIKGKKSSEQYLKQLYKLEGEEKALASVLGKTIKPKVKPSVSKGMESVTETSPQFSKYWGKGMYERTEGGLLPRAKGGLGLQFDKRLGLALGITTTQTIEEKQREKQIQKELSKTTPKLSLAIKTTPKFKDILGVSENLAQESVQKLDTLQRQQLITPSVRGINLITDQLITPKPTKIKKPRILFPFPDETKGKALRKIRQQPHILEIKSKKKWKKVGKVFPSEQRAKDVGAYITDVTLPAQFRVKQTKKKPTEQQFKVPPNYAQLFGFKFRPYKIRKQVKIPLKQRFIERKIFRLDTAGEVKKIHLEKYLAEQRRKSQQRVKQQQRLDRLFFPQFRQSRKSKRKKK